MSENKNEPLPAPPAAVAKLGAGYRGRRFWPRRPTLLAALDTAGAGDAGDDAAYVAASALRPSFPYRRPVPIPDEDDMFLGPQAAKEDAAVTELEAGLAAAADGPPHQGDEDGGDNDGEDAGGAVGDGNDEDDDDGLYTANSSFSSTNLDTEQALAYAMEWDEADIAGGQQENSRKPASSPEPSQFQEDRESARSLLAAGAFFASMGKGMLQEHHRARQEADMYLEEVTLAREKLPN